MRLDVPSPPPNYDVGFFNRAFSSIQQVLSFGVSRLEAVDGVLLQAPDGSVWKVTVSNTGTLTTTSVPLGQTGSPTY